VLRPRGIEKPAGDGLLYRCLQCDRSWEVELIVADDGSRRMPRGWSHCPNAALAVVLDDAVQPLS